MRLELLSFFFVVWLVACIATIFPAKVTAQDLPAGEEIGSINWKNLDADDLPKGATIVTDDVEGKVLSVTRTSGMKQQIALGKFDKPEIKKPTYAVRGKIRYKGVTKNSFLEMWSHFPEPKKGAYFSRTMAPSGPQAFIVGDSPWREFTIPFFSNDDTPAPERLELNIVLPGTGAVWISDMRLEEFDYTMPSSIGWPILTVISAVGIVIGGLLTSLVVVALAVWAWRRRGKTVVDEQRRMQALDIH